MKQKVLLIEDDQELGNNIKTILESENFKAILCESGETGLDCLDDTINLVILDIILPGISGIEVCQQIRVQSDVPILFLTGKNSDADKVKGFSAGADDYLTKPFSYIELITRVKALIRRYERYLSRQYLCVGRLKADLINNEFYKNTFELKLTRMEGKLLVYLMSHAGQVLSSSEIYENVWHEHFYYANHNTVMVHIRSLRQKIEDDPNDPQYIKTIWGKGYEFEAIQ